MLLKIALYPDDLTERQEAVIRAVIERSHAYYMLTYEMPKPCMWPDELMTEIRLALSHPRLPPDFFGPTADPIPSE